MLNKIGVNACVLGRFLNLSQYIAVEQDRGRHLCFGAFSKSLAAHRCWLNKSGANACALRPSLNLSQHIDVEQDRGKRFYGQLRACPRVLRAVRGLYGLYGLYGPYGPLRASWSTGCGARASLRTLAWFPQGSGFLGLRGFGLRFPGLGFRAASGFFKV